MNITKWNNFAPWRIQNQNKRHFGLIAPPFIISYLASENSLIQNRKNWKPGHLEPVDANVGLERNKTTLRSFEHENITEIYYFE